MQDDLRLSLKALRAFVAVVDHGSIAAAARSLNVAASAVAALVDQVEAELGAALLIRTRARGIAPTPEGRALAARLRALLDDYATCLTQARDAATAFTGTLRIGYYAPVAPAFLPQVLRPLTQAHPDLRIDLQEHDNDSVQRALLSGQVDLAILAGDDTRPGLVTRPLLDLPPYVLMPADHALAHTPRISLAEVARHPLILLDRPISRLYVETLFQGAGLAPTIAARANATEMVRSLVGAGHGIAILNMQPLTRTSYGGDLLTARPLAHDGAPLSLISARPDTAPRRLVTTAQEALHSWMSGPAATALTLS